MLSDNLDLECHKTQPNTSADGRKPLVGLPRCLLPLTSAVMPQVLDGGATAKLSVGVQHQARVRLLVGQINSQNRVGL